MQICFYIPALKHNQNKTIFGGMFSSFYNELEKQNIKVNFTTELSQVAGDILVVHIGGEQEKTAAKAMNKFNGPVILYVHNAYINFYKSFLKRWNKRILFAYCTDFATLNYKKYNSVNIPYYHLPFASDENIFHPLYIEKKYDITFLGNGNSGFGRERYINLLVDYAKKNKLKMFLAGSGWDKFGFPYQIVKHGEKTNLIYNASKICVNIHNDRQYAGIDLEMDANNRLFDLAMAQCCQVSNGENMVAKYFKPDEIITADNAEDWINKIDYYLKNEIERNEIAQKARSRALNEHTWYKRATEFIEIVNENYPDYNLRDQKVNIFIRFGRMLDQIFPPLYLIKEIRPIRYVLTKLKLTSTK